MEKRQADTDSGLLCRFYRYKRDSPLFHHRSTSLDQLNWSVTIQSFRKWKIPQILKRDAYQLGKTQLEVIYSLNTEGRNSCSLVPKYILPDFRNHEWVNWLKFQSATLCWCFWSAFGNCKTDYCILCFCIELYNSRSVSYIDWGRRWA